MSLTIGKEEIIHTDSCIKIKARYLADDLMEFPGWLEGAQRGKILKINVFGEGTLFLAMNISTPLKISPNSVNRMRAAIVQITSRLILVIEGPLFTPNPRW
jgi:hypothetical protein